MKKEKRFDVVKHVKSLSRDLLKTPPGRALPAKKRKLLRNVSRQEMLDPEREV